MIVFENEGSYFVHLQKDSIKRQKRYLACIYDSETYQPIGPEFRLSTCNHLWRSRLNFHHSDENHRISLIEIVLSRLAFNMIKHNGEYIHRRKFSEVLIYTHEKEDYMDLFNDFLQ